MTLTTQQSWQVAYQRLLFIESENNASDTNVNRLLESLPVRLAHESYLEWLKRSIRLSNVIAFPKLKYRRLTVVQRKAAQAKDGLGTLPSTHLISQDQQFRLTITELPHNKLKIKLEALGLASSKYVHALLGISGEDSKDDLICIIRLNSDAEGEEINMDNTVAIRQALLRPVISLINE